MHLKEINDQLGEEADDSACETQGVPTGSMPAAGQVFVPSLGVMVPCRSF